MTVITDNETESIDVNQRLAQLFEGKENLQKLKEIIPGAVAEITMVMQAEQDVIVRERVKRMFKGLLEYLAADTKYRPKQEEAEKNQKDLFN